MKAAAQSGGRLSFFVTANEWRQSRSLPNYHFYLVLNAESRKRSVLVIESARLPKDALFPANYSASLRGPFSAAGT
ncbi:MAG: hypothetical protein HYU51_12280 [Candidatus Rokubacteria bacterium]|nr:hypothetical protein [Candidatus Rokubacteria bacterium]